MNKIYLIAIPIAVAIGILAILLTLNEPTEIADVKMGYLDLPVSSLPLYVALENNYFEENDITLELTKFQTSNSLAEALVNGQIDIAVAPATVPLYAIETRSPDNFKIFMSHSLSSKDPFTQVMVKKDSEISKLEDLQGKSLGLFPGSTAIALTKLTLENMDLKNLDVELVSLPPSVWVESLSTGQVDAILTYEPWGTRILQQDVGKKILEAPFERFVLDDQPGASSVFATSFVEKNPDIAKKIMGIFEESLVFIKENPEQSRSLMPKYSELEESVAMSTPVLSWAVGENIDADTYQKYADILYQQGELEKSVDVTQMLYVVPQKLS